MINSPVEKNGKFVCGECSQNLGKENVDKINYCPRCGNPLNIKSAANLERNMLQDKISLLTEVLIEMDEGADARETLKQFIEELEESKK